jgi:hypothetical protein
LAGNVTVLVGDGPGGGTSLALRAEWLMAAAVEALAGRAKPSRPTVIPAVARMVEGAFFMSPLRDL